jgi:hypothetical protein
MIPTPKKLQIHFFVKVEMMASSTLTKSIKDHQVTKNTITFPWVVEDPKKPVHLLKIFPDEPGHRIVNSVPSKL